MRKIGVLCALCLCTSCNWFTSKEVKTKELVDQEMLSIDWNAVDQYPLFTNCDELALKEVQRNCFETTLLSHFSTALKAFDFVMETPINETVYVDFLMQGNGRISIVEIQENKNILRQMPEFNTIIIKSLKSLPKVSPAVKRGIPVRAKFRIPIVINTE